MGIATRITKRTAIIGSAIALAAVGGGIAFAAWTSAGNGNGTASASSAVDVTISAGTPSTALYPNVAPVNVLVNVGNTNPYAVDLTGLALSGPITVDAGHSACNVSSLHFLASGATIHVLGAGTATDQVAGTITMDNSATNACQGASFSVPLTGTATSA